MERMKAVVKTQRAQGAELLEVPIPEIKSDEVLVKVKATSICGSDLHIYQWNEWSQSRIKVPQIMGHELAGEVVEVGKEVTSVKIGDYVSAETHIPCGRCYPCRTGKPEVCLHLKILGVDRDGAFAEYVAIPEIDVWKNDPSIPPESASIQEPLGNAVDTVLAEDVAAKTVLCLGDGPVGLLAIGVAKASGASLIIATDLRDYRLELAQKMGAHIILNPRRDNVEEVVLDHTHGAGVDVVLEMSGSPEALAQGLRLVTPGGRVSLLGLFDRNVEVDLNNGVVLKAVRVYGITGRRMFSTWYKSSRLLSSGLLDVTPLITHKFPLTEFQKGMELMGRGECGKVVLFP